jgi:hypothetical protein
VDTRHGHGPKPPADLQHEIRDVRVGPLAWLGLGLALLVILAFLAMKGLFDFLDRQRARTDAAPPPMMTQRPQEPPEPRLQTTPIPSRKSIAEQESKRLTTYGWVDQKRAVVRIPIEQAMTLLAERGLPSRGGTTGLPAASEVSASVARRGPETKAGNEGEKR